MADEQQQPGGDRMDRFERGLERLLAAQAKHEAEAETRFQRADERMERFERGLDHLLQAQAIHNEALIRITGVVEHLAEAQRAWGEETDRRFRHTDERLNALIKVVDGVIRKPPPEA